MIDIIASPDDHDGSHEASSLKRVMPVVAGKDGKVSSGSSCSVGAMLSGLSMIADGVETERLDDLSAETDIPEVARSVIAYRQQLRRTIVARACN
ncbi:MAG: hypothetical protein MZV63_48760 [Marinilabiliales bacterium]|nr:hypothetical protein [Marinilabiliales bacterium]